MIIKKNKNIFDRIKDVIYNNIKGLIKVDKKKTYIQSFIKILKEQNTSEFVQNNLQIQFEKNLTYITDDNNLEQISNIIWLTLVSNIEKNTLHIKNIQELNIKELLVYGLPGSGKTTFISKYLSQHKIQNIYYKTNNKNNIPLLQQWCNTNIQINTSELHISETNDPNTLKEYQEEKYKASIILVIDINTTYELAKFTLDTIQIDYIIITKIDQLKYINLLIELPIITKAKIIYLQDEEIANKNNTLKESSHIVTLLAQKILNKKITNKQEIQQLINAQMQVVDLNTYRIYLQFINQLDVAKIKNMSNIYQQATKYLKIDELKNYEQYINQIKNPDSQKKIMKQAMNQMYIIDSMNKKERINPTIITNARLRIIIKGSGTNMEKYNHTINSYNKYTDIIKNMKNQKDKYNEIIKNI
jgi:signal recognition particle GTPase